MRRWRSGAALLGGNDGDLDQHARIGERGLNAGAPRQVLSAGPGVPRLVHGIPVADVGHPDGCRNQLGLVRTAEFQKPVDLLQDLLRLTLGVLLDVIGNDAGREDKAIGFDDFGIDLGRFVTRNGHGDLPAGSTQDVLACAPAPLPTHKSGSSYCRRASMMRPLMAALPRASTAIKAASFLSRASASRRG